MGTQRPADLRIVRVSMAHPDARLLTEEVQQEYVVRYGSRDETPYDATEFDPPTGAFYVGYREGLPVTMGGWRFRDDVSRLGSPRPVEIKRMYVVPAARRSGLARLMLAHLEATARDAGADVVILETGLEQPEGISLYESSGYERIDGFGHYRGFPSNRCYARRLA